MQAESLSKLNFSAIHDKFEQAKILARWNLNEKLDVAIRQTQKCEKCEAKFIACRNLNRLLVKFKLKTL